MFSFYVFCVLVVLLLTKHILQFYFLLQTNMYVCMYAAIQFHSFFLNTTTAITQTLAFRRANENKLKENWKKHIHILYDSLLHIHSGTAVHVVFVVHAVRAMLTVWVRVWLLFLLNTYIHTHFICCLRVFIKCCLCAWMSVLQTFWWRTASFPLCRWEWADIGTHILTYIQCMNVFKNPHMHMLCMYVCLHTFRSMYIHMYIHIRILLYSVLSGDILLN